MSRWFRVYDDMVDDPKVQRLAPPLFKAWINILCLSSQHGGHLPNISDVAFKLRVSYDKAAVIIDDLKKAGLVDDYEMPDGSFWYAPHNWSGRQFKSDVSNERVQRHRNGKRNVTPTVTETPPDTEQIQSRTDTAPDGATTGNGKYAFESGIIRLTAKDFSKWQKAFTYLDLEAELISLTKWAGEQGPENWFFAVSGALAKRNRDEKIRREKPPSTQPANPLFEGIT